MSKIGPNSFAYFDVEGTPVRRLGTDGPEVYRGGKWEAYASPDRLSRCGRQISHVELKKLVKEIDKLNARQPAGEKPTGVWQHP